MIKILIWKEYEYGNLKYLVSNSGILIGTRGRELKQRTSEDGYMEVTLGDMDHRVVRKVHRIVAELFVGGYVDGYEVNHKDFNRQNNHASNLEWLSHSENIAYSIRAGNYNHRQTVGSKNGHSKLVEDDIVKIRDFLDNGIPVATIARQFGVGWTTISHIKNHETWTHVS